MAIDPTALAPLGLRFAARLIDIVAVALLCLVVNLYFLVQLYQETAPQVENYRLGDSWPTATSEANRLALIIVIVTVGLWFAYEVPATANSGQTIGKRMLGIKVVRIVDDKPLSFGQAFRRWLILALPSPPVSFPCGIPLQVADLIWCTWDRPAQQCLHDKAVASMVVHAERRPAGSPGAP